MPGEPQDQPQPDGRPGPFNPVEPERRAPGRRGERGSRFVGDLDEAVVTRPDDQTLTADEAAALERLVYGDAV